MSTDLIEIDPENPSTEAIDRAVALLRRGEVIAVPTDALYAIIADPFSLRAIGKVYEAKGRESTRSLPVMVQDYMTGEELVSEVNTRYYLLARRFWPGPLTIIVPASAKLPLKLTGNTGRLALRHSKSAVVQALIERMGQPLVATSANRSGEPTLRSGIEVFGVMDGQLSLVLDGGHCNGRGATTVDITEPYWRVIREGDITEKDISEVLHGT